MAQSQTFPSKQKAARSHGNQDVRVEEVEVPALQPGEVRVKVAYAGICGSDLHEYYEGPHSCTCTPHPVTGTTMPMTLGHEFSGTVVEVSEGVDTDRLKVGSRVCIEPIISCLKCEPCLAGNRPLCRSKIGFFGYNRPGGLASYTNITQKNVHVVPDHVALDAAALAEPLAVAWHAVRQSGFTKGETALVLGAGPIGALVTKVLKAQGASWVAVSEPNKTRAQTALTCGADAVYDPTQVDVVKAVRDATNGGVNIAIDCAGIQRTFDAGVAATGTKGRIVMLGIWRHKAQIDLADILFNEKVVTASCCFLAQDMKEVVEALSDGTIKVDELITGKIALEDVVDKGIKALKYDEGHIKILVDLQHKVSGP